MSVTYDERSSMSLDIYTDLFAEEQEVNQNQQNLLKLECEKLQAEISVLEKEKGMSDEQRLKALGLIDTLATNFHAMWLAARMQLRDYEEQIAGLENVLTAPFIVQCTKCHQNFNFTNERPPRPVNVRPLNGKNTVELRFADNDSMQTWLNKQGFQLNADSLPTLPGALDAWVKRRTSKSLLCWSDILKAGEGQVLHKNEFIEGLRQDDARLAARGEQHDLIQTLMSDVVENIGGSNTQNGGCELASVDCATGVQSYTDKYDKNASSVVAELPSRNVTRCTAEPTYVSQAKQTHKSYESRWTLDERQKRRRPSSCNRPLEGAKTPSGQSAAWKKGGFGAALHQPLLRSPHLRSSYALRSPNLRNDNRLVRLDSGSRAIRGFNCERRDAQLFNDDMRMPYELRDRYNEFCEADNTEVSSARTNRSRCRDSRTHYNYDSGVHSRKSSVSRRADRSTNDRIAKIEQPFTLPSYVAQSSKRHNDGKADGDRTFNKPTGSVPQNKTANNKSGERRAPVLDKKKQQHQGDDVSCDTISMQQLHSLVHSSVNCTEFRAQKVVPSYEGAGRDNNCKTQCVDYKPLLQVDSGAMYRTAETSAVSLHLLSGVPPSNRSVLYNDLCLSSESITQRSYIACNGDVPLMNYHEQQAYTARSPSKNGTLTRLSPHFVEETAILKTPAYPSRSPSPQPNGNLGVYSAIELAHLSSHDLQQKTPPIAYSEERIGLSKDVVVEVALFASDSEDDDMEPIIVSFDHQLSQTSACSDTDEKAEEDTIAESHKEKRRAIEHHSLYCKKARVCS